MRKIRGFTLVELMIVVAIIGVLSAFAYSSYSNSVTRARRSDGKGAVMDLAQRIERFYSENNTYNGVAAGVGGSPQNSPEGFYAITITVPNPNSGSGYFISAAPQNGQESADTECQTLTLTDQGIEGIASGSGGAPTSTAEQCWGR